MAMRAVEVSTGFFLLLEPFMDFERGHADLADQLRTHFSVIEVNVCMRRITVGTADQLQSCDTLDDPLETCL